MRSTRRRWLLALLAPLVVVLTAEALLQLGSLVVRAGAREMPRNWLTDHTRILALGDSNTFGIYVEPDESYPAQLEARWNRAFPDHSIEVLNLGYPGMNSFRVLDNADAWMKKYRPDVVLLIVGINDFLTPVEAIAYEGDSAFARLVRAVGKHSRLLHFVHMFRQSRKEPTEVEIEDARIAWDDDVNKRVGRMMEFKQANEGAAGDEVMRADGEEFVVLKKGEPANDVRHLAENLGRIQETIERNGGELYLLTYAASQSYYARSNQVTRAYASGGGVHFIDLAAALHRVCPRSDRCPDLFFQDLHPKAPGYAIVAKTIVERLADDWSLTR